MGRIVTKNQPCKACGSSDALQIYEDVLYRFMKMVQRSAFHVEHHNKAIKRRSQ